MLQSRAKPEGAQLFDSCAALCPRTREAVEPSHLAAFAKDRAKLTILAKKYAKYDHLSPLHPHRALRSPYLYFLPFLPLID
jgi:hypothetical protein